MGGNEKQRDLKAEELENRVAPMALVYSEPAPDPSDPGSGSGSGTTTTSTDQPGNSDGHRSREFKQQA